MPGSQGDKEVLVKKKSGVSERTSLETLGYSHKEGVCTVKLIYPP